MGGINNEDNKNLGTMDMMARKRFIMEGKIIYIGEYSNDQKAYNITTLEEAVRINLEMMSNGVFNGYIPICYGFSREEVRNKLEQIEEKLGRP